MLPKSHLFFFLSSCVHTGWSTPGNRVPFCIVSSSPYDAVVPRLVSYSAIHFFCFHSRTSWSVRYFGILASSRPPSHPYTPVIVLGVLFNRRQPRYLLVFDRETTRCKITWHCERFWRWFVQRAVHAMCGSKLHLAMMKTRICCHSENMNIFSVRS